jgi:hypothetical protein
MDVFSKIFMTGSGSIFVLVFSLSTAQAVSISDLLITEVMANPSKVDDRIGEWFELFNPTSESINLNNIIIKDNNKDSHIIDYGGPLLILPKGFFVLALSSSIIEEGGFIVNYVYDYNHFKLANVEDEIILSDTKSNFLSLNYLSGFVKKGKSSELISKDMTLANYQPTASVNTYGAGDFGTPGSSSSAQKFINNIPAPSTAMLFIFILYFFKQLKYKVIGF